MLSLCNAIFRYTGRRSSLLSAGVAVSDSGGRHLDQCRGGSGDAVRALLPNVHDSAGGAGDELGASMSH